MQIAFILAELIVPENDEYVLISDDFRAISLKIKQEFFEVGYSENTDNFPCFYNLTNLLGKGGIMLCHYFCKKFREK